MQGVYPSETAIINRDHERIPFTITPKDRAETQKQITNILAVMHGEKPPLRLTSSCKNSPWYHECVQEAQAADDIALIYNLDARSHDALRGAGVHTIHDAARMDVAGLPKIPFASAAKLERAREHAHTGHVRFDPDSTRNPFPQFFWIQP
ncbi:MAG: hypothetical protein A3C15_00635 [Candidatus Magasanikbacteria bacterium RIFCSPHIGHO2_02_FULL_50_9b]|uniref:Uncharacterized protein n=1 Tax=Candidatus Magasanikbacteria bacterium RIFCSPHIGHO2_02_FULL_50_9b TaxID=1798682 RepID=A0A1F6M8U0_9BACT|nr:MAG: hypothetical protein A3C15_00635 [Candidatus Magasanikbacteria bacterium RIFCSPHIGHO2_02_FULL_50_9b]